MMLGALLLCAYLLVRRRRGDGGVPVTRPPGPDPASDRDAVYRRRREAAEEFARNCVDLVETFARLRREWTRHNHPRLPREEDRLAYRTNRDRALAAYERVDDLLEAFIERYPHYDLRSRVVGGRRVRRAADVPRDAFPRADDARRRARPVGVRV